MNALRLNAFLLSCLLLPATLHSETSIHIFSDGYPGQNSQEIHAKFHTDLVATHPNYVLLFTGMNDSANEKKFLTVEESIAHIDAMIQDALAQNAQPILITVQNVDKRVLQRHDPKVYGSAGPNERIDRLDKAIQDLATRRNIPVADFHAAVKSVGGPNEALSIDGVHLTVTGYHLLAKTVRAALPQSLPADTTILCIGDSITMGIGVRTGGPLGPQTDFGSPNTYPAQLSAMLNGSSDVPPSTDPDIVIYGGTASGIMTAYSAAKEGLHVVLLEPGAHLGGMVTGGLSATDLGHFTIIGGYARDFYLQAAAHYGHHDLNVGADWLSEPHVDLAIFQQMLHDAGVEIHMQERLREHDGVEKKDGKLLSIITEDGRQWHANFFADCSYEGDLMAQAKVTYTVGREASSVYNEGLGGVREKTPKHQFLWFVSAYDAHHHLLPEVDPGPLATPGSGDKKVQAYNFRLILTHDPANRAPFTKPAGYDCARFALFANYLKDFEKHAGRAPNFHDVTNPVAIPNQKADFNNNGPFSTDYIAHSWRYPDASYAERAEIWKAHLLYTQSFFYFLSHDPVVPASLRAEVNEWGLSKDEFADTDHWPNQLYIREGRRMVGEYVMKQSDLQTDLTKTDSIGMGSYNSDSHNVQRVAMPDGSVQNEGDMQIPVQPYEISYRAILPKRAEAVNLLVPVCLSASHAAYSSVRMEPQYMIIGQAAGVAASLAIRHHVPVQDVSIPELQKELHAHGAILHLEEQVSGIRNMYR